MSLYEKLGGANAIQSLVYIFYNKILLDDRINDFFRGTDMDKLIEKQKGFLSMVLGGPQLYTGKNLRDAHAPLLKIGLNDSHFDAVAEHLQATMVELGVGADDIATVMNIAESTRKDVLGR
jgi:hemoglobin